MTKYNISGMSTDYIKYSNNTQQKILTLLPDIRKKVYSTFNGLNHNEGLLSGRRFRDDENIIWRIASNVSEAKCLEDMEEVITEALYDAASSDYYYTYEKDWN